MVLPTTNRDMTGSIVKEGFMNPTEKRSNINPTDKARSTIKETTINNSTEGNMVPDMYTPYNGLNDKAKQTTRQIIFILKRTEIPELYGHNTNKSKTFP